MSYKGLAFFAPTYYAARLNANLRSNERNKEIENNEDKKRNSTLVMFVLSLITILYTNIMR